jgi:microcystin-dependent protein
MWYGDPNSIPNGWEIFYQMGGRFPVGAHHISTDEGLTKYSFGDKGGEEKHTLTINEMPSHNHTANLGGDGFPDGSGDRGGNYHYSGSGSQLATNNTGGGQSHENRPPYLAIYFIKKK